MKKLIVFLKKHRVLTKFKKNFNKQGNCKTIERLCEIVKPQSFIFSAFTWDGTDEGIRFWSNLNDEWKASL